MFGFGWRSRLRRDLNGLSLVECIDYFGIGRTAESYRPADIEKVVKHFSIVRDNSASLQHIPDVVESLKQFAKVHNFTDATMLTVLAICQFESLRVTCMVEVAGPYRFVTAGRLSTDDFCRHVFRVINDEKIIPVLFPPVFKNDIEKFSLERAERQILFDFFIRSVKSESHFINLVRDYASLNPYFYMYPTIIRPAAYF